MKIAVILILLFIQTQVVFGQNNEPPMTIEKIAEEFDKKYSATYHDGYVSFEKRKNNWFVVYNTFQNNKWMPQEKYLFYDGKTNRFKDLKLDKNTGNTEVKVTDYLSPFDIGNFNLQAYFGYNGWYKDVIREYEGKQNLSDNELYGLARAYSAHAGCLISDAMGNALPEEIWDLPFSINSLSPAQIERFIKLDNKAIANFKKLADRNPGYETVVGKIGIKHANEYMFQYQVLLAYANSYAEKINLPPNLYTEEQLSAAKKDLESCPPNSILFSTSDNEYYPVHYLQKAKGLRRDVYLVNSSLLGLDRHIFRATFPHYDAQPINIGLDTSFYLGSKNDLIYIKDADFLFLVRDLRSFLEQPKPDEYGYTIIEANRIGLTETREQKGDTEISVNKIVALKNARYLTKNQWILLSILENLRGRKICFTTLFYEGDALVELNNFLKAKDDVWIYDN